MKTVYLGSREVEDGYNGHKAVIHLCYWYAEDVVCCVHPSGYYTRNLLDFKDVSFNPVEYVETKEKPKVLIIGPAKPPISEIAKHLIEKADLIMMEPDKIHAPLGQVPGYEAASIFSLNMGMTIQYKARRTRSILNSFSAATGKPANLVNRDRKRIRPQ